MLKRLTRKLVILLVLCAALTAVTFAPASHARGGVFCLDAPIESGCYGLMCCNDWGGCWCVN